MNLFEQYLSDVADRMERTPTFRPTCCECGDPITGTSFNGRCFTCMKAEAREDAVNETRYEEEAP